jgi:hypothetical protein
LAPTFTVAVPRPSPETVNPYKSLFDPADAEEAGRDLG